MSNHLPLLTSRPWWPWLKRAAIAVFFVAVLSLLVAQAKDVDWAEVLSALRGYPLVSVGLAVLLAVVSFALYSCFDLLGRHYTGHQLGTLTVMTVTFVSYVFNLSHLQNSKIAWIGDVADAQMMRV